MIHEVPFAECFHCGQRALAELDFQEHTGKTEMDIAYWAFYHSKCDALIGLPNLTDTDLLEPVHLHVAEKTVERRGVADSETFFQLLRREAQKEAQVA